MAPKSNKITTASTAEYFSKNLQQVGFSSATKAVLTTLKEAVDNSLDACEDHGVPPEIEVEIERLGAGTLKNNDRVRIRVTDNGPGLSAEIIPQVFGEYLASSKFGRGRCSRGQQGIGISAATTWAQLTNAQGASVTSKTKEMRKAIKCMVEVDIKNNKGVVKNKETIDWDRPHGVAVEFIIDGRVQLNGEGGLLNYLTGTSLVNPHLTLKYKLPVQGGSDEKPKWVTVPRVSDIIPEIPDATEPHPHTMKLGEFIAHSHLFGKTTVSNWLKKGFSRVSDGTLTEMKKSGLKPALLSKSVDALSDTDFKDLFQAIQNAQFMAPSTRSVLSIGEEQLSKSMNRLGTVDFFSVVSRKPCICDFKPVQVEVAVARLKDKVSEKADYVAAAAEPQATETKAKGKAKGKAGKGDKDDAAKVAEGKAAAKAEAAALPAAGLPRSDDPDAPATVLRFANRVPLQFDKAACAIVQAIGSVNWRAYSLAQPKDSIPIGPYVIAVSVVSPFIKFKNASKETIDASDELVEEIRRALIQAGQRLSRHIRREDRANDLEEKLRYIEQFCPILVEGLCRITKAPDARKKRAEEGLVKILGRDAKEAKAELAEADQIVVAAEAAKAAKAAAKAAAKEKQGSEQ